MGAEWTVETAAQALGMKPAEIAEAGTKFGLPWVRTADDGEYVWVDGVVHIFSKPMTAWEREKGLKEPQYDGLACPRYIPTAAELAAEADEPDDDGDDDASDSDGPTFDPSEHTVDEVLAYVATADRDEVVRVTELELAGKSRQTLTPKLTDRLIEIDDADDGDDDAS